MAKRVLRGVRGHSAERPIWRLVGRRLRVRRMALDLTADDVARRLGIAPSEYQSYEAGARETPALLLCQAADVLGVPVLWFFSDVMADGEQEDELATCVASSAAYRVATTEERLGYLAESFRRLDLEDQQHLLAIADALSRSGRK